MSNQNHPGVIAPPPLIYFGFLFVGWGLGRLVGDYDLGLTVDWRRGVAIALIVGGLLLDGMAAGTFRRFGTPPEPWKASTALVDSGPDRFSRNPIYVGFAITYAGLAIAMNSLWALVLLAPCLVVVDRWVILREERYLESRFGQPYRDYKARVRRWL